MVILSKLRTLKVDITSSPDYGSEATRRAKALVDEIMTTISKQQSKIMQRGYTPVGANLTNMSSGFNGTNMIGNMMGTSSPYKKNRVAIIADINTIQSKILRDPKISQFVTNLVNRKLETIKRLK